MNKLALGTVQFGIKYGINNSHGIPSDKAVDEILSPKESFVSTDNATACLTTNLTTCIKIAR